MSTLMGCAIPKNEVETVELDVCFILYNINQSKFVKQENMSSCKDRISPGSTFKIPLYLIASNEGVVKDPQETFVWDGKKRMIDAWNADQTATAWIQNSTVWVSQIITSKIATEKIESYLKKFKFGNADASGAKNSFWLTKAPFSLGAKSSLRVSAYEQVNFLNTLWKHKLKVSKKSMDEIISILKQEDISTPTLTFYGKTGSGFIDYETYERLGWFVGYVTKGSDTYSFAVKVEDRVAQKAPQFAGALAKSIAVDKITKALK